MSMTTLTILQLIELFGVYTLMSVILPAIIFHRKFAGQQFVVRIMGYITIGNFFMMNLVFLLELLHIAYVPIMIALTVIPAVFLTIKLNHIQVRGIFNTHYEYLQKLSLGYMGARTFRQVLYQWFLRQFKKVTDWCKRYIFKYTVEWIVILLLSALLFYIFGSNSLVNMGYCASDLPVHNFWINELGKNNIFADGVYPYGFHCVMYYLHSVFFIDTYVILRLFGIVQLFYVAFMLLAFLYAVCKSRFAPILGFGAYWGLNVWNTGALSRFHSALPQEFGMIFILPGIYFAYAYFRVRKTEDVKVPKIKGRKRFDPRTWQQSTWCLVLFALNFSMTLAAHFYVTMIAGLFCVGIALGFIGRFLRRGYFMRVIEAGLVAVFIAVLPMGIAFATGTPLQGSLNWGLEVITGSQEEEITQEESTEEPMTEETTEDGVTGDQGDTGETTNENRGDSAVVTDENSTTGNIVRMISGTLVREINAMIDEYLLQDAQNGFHIYVYLIMAASLISAVLMFFRDRQYAMEQISAVIYVGLLLILFAAAQVGLPELMDSNRSRIFVVYGIAMLFGMAVDGIVVGLLGWIKWQWVMQTASFVCLLGGVYYSYTNQLIREPDYLNALESNGAITCLANIIHDEPDGTWTIVSANDELRMGEDHGYHYETITFLRMMEHTSTVDITIPTNRVYIFIEKIPLDYQVSYENSGQHVSEEGAMLELPQGNGLDIYERENRWIVMSRMYYWAQTYQQMYPNEMQVYYEDDNFICYCIKQNAYSLNNFAIDYGFNQVEDGE